MLPGISTEQLRSRLNRMVADGMLTRKRYREVPPRVDYELTDRARDLMPVLAALARWGYDWTWSEPRGSESVDVGAIFRLAPGLVSPSEPARTIEFSITDADAMYTITITPDHVEVAEHEADAPDARARGSEAGWIAALSPGHNRDGLEIDGDAALVGGILDVISPASHETGQAGNRAAAA